MRPQTYIFIGRSGCGKGTQADLLQKRLVQDDNERQVFYVRSGDLFRNFIKGEGYSGKLSKAIYESGGLQPEFLSAWMWSNELIRKMTGDEHLIFDGTPRRLHEARILDTALIDFYKREKPFAIFINVSEAWAIERLTERGRSDDKDPLEIEKRMEWYSSDVVPTIKHFRESKSYTFLEIDGEGTIEQVGKIISEAVFSV